MRKVVSPDLLHQKHSFTLTFMNKSCNTLHINTPIPKQFLQEDSGLLHLQADERARKSCVSTWLSSLPSASTEVGLFDNHCSCYLYTLVEVG